MINVDIPVFGGVCDCQRLYPVHKRHFYEENLSPCVIVIGDRCRTPIDVLPIIIGDSQKHL